MSFRISGNQPKTKKVTKKSVAEALDEILDDPNDICDHKFFTDQYIRQRNHKWRNKNVKP